ncbi:receptor-type tyrosine-protein phosphatase kappa [Plakobranchus ocellatus]|uniref:Receptor-type tyrosine-protein phosphatase kappa n=1 Tax=Plakobranchus ocellatus TaxID=259542 RepID=A0AAV4AQL9_9GAST|nr:receptor-type tyrosine-protein phosphatase kappa [Plakobranchus ocellatus]
MKRSGGRRNDHRYNRHRRAATRPHPYLTAQRHETGTSDLKSTFMAMKNSRAAGLERDKEARERAHRRREERMSKYRGRKKRSFGNVPGVLWLNLNPSDVSERTTVVIGDGKGLHDEPNIPLSPSTEYGVVFVVLSTVVDITKHRYEFATTTAFTKKLKVKDKMIHVNLILFILLPILIVLFFVLGFFVVRHVVKKQSGDQDYSDEEEIESDDKGPFSISSEISDVGRDNLEEFDDASSGFNEDGDNDAKMKHALEKQKNIDTPMKNLTQLETFFNKTNDLQQPRYITTMRENVLYPPDSTAQRAPNNRNFNINSYSTCTNNNSDRAEEETQIQDIVYRGLSCEDSSIVSNSCSTGSIHSSISLNCSSHTSSTFNNNEGISPKALGKTVSDAPLNDFTRPKDANNNRGTFCPDKLSSLSPPSSSSFLLLENLLNANGNLENYQASPSNVLSTNTKLSSNQNRSTNKEEQTERSNLSQENNIARDMDNLRNVILPLYEPKEKTVNERKLVKSGDITNLSERKIRHNCHCSVKGDQGSHVDQLHLPKTSTSGKLVSKGCKKNIICVRPIEQAGTSLFRRVAEEPSQELQPVHLDTDNSNDVFSLLSTIEDSSETTRLSPMIGWSNKQQSNQFIIQDPTCISNQACATISSLPSLTDDVFLEEAVTGLGKRACIEDYIEHTRSETENSVFCTEQSNHTNSNNNHSQRNSESEMHDNEDTLVDIFKEEEDEEKGVEEEEEKEEEDDEEEEKEEEKNDKDDEGGNDEHDKYDESDSQDDNNDDASDVKTDHENTKRRSGDNSRDKQITKFRRGDGDEDGNPDKNRNIDASDASVNDLKIETASVNREEIPEESLEKESDCESDADNDEDAKDNDCQVDEKSGLVHSRIALGDADYLRKAKKHNASVLAAAKSGSAGSQSTMNANNEKSLHSAEKLRLAKSAPQTSFFSKIKFHKRNTLPINSLEQKRDSQKKNRISFSKDIDPKNAEKNYSEKSDSEYRSREMETSTPLPLMRSRKIGRSKGKESKLHTQKDNNCEFQPSTADIIPFLGVTGDKIILSATETNTDAESENGQTIRKDHGNDFLSPAENKYCSTHSSKKLDQSKKLKSSKNAKKSKRVENLRGTQECTSTRKKSQVLKNKPSNSYPQLDNLRSRKTKSRNRNNSPQQSQDSSIDWDSDLNRVGEVDKLETKTWFRQIRFSNRKNTSSFGPGNTCNSFEPGPIAISGSIEAEELPMTYLTELKCACKLPSSDLIDRKQSAPGKEKKSRWNSLWGRKWKQTIGSDDLDRNQTVVEPGSFSLSNNAFYMSPTKPGQLIHEQPSGLSKFFGRRRLGTHSCQLSTRERLSRDSSSSRGRFDFRRRNANSNRPESTGAISEKRTTDDLSSFFLKKGLSKLKRANSKHQLSFKDEFRILEKYRKIMLKTLSFEGAKEHWNKNRFPNILPPDHSRVNVERVSEEETDYFNAVFMKDMGLNTEYIAAQTPFCPSSVNDFWRMVLQNRVETIVLLCNCIENGVVKCHQYWADSGVFVGGAVLVETQETKDYADFVLRTLKLSSACSEDLIVHHFHFLSWPATCVPDDTFPLLELRYHVRRHHGSKTTPLLVQCATGVARSSVFIAVDALIEEYGKNGYANVYRFVKKMRRAQPYSVKTFQYYLLIYEALFEEFQAGDTILKGNFRDRYQQLCQKNPLSDSSYLVDQYKMLEGFTPPLSLEACATALKPKNRKKNVTLDIVPSDWHRPILNIGTGDKPPSGYINAVFVDGLIRKSEFIVTQAPLVTSEFDFWRMIYDYQVQTIVMLGQCKGSNRRPYFPKTGARQFQYITVEHVTTAQLGVVKVRNLKMGVFTVRGVEKMALRHFHVKHWADDDSSLKIYKLESMPSSKADLLTLIDMVMDWQMLANRRTSPIVVVDTDGACISGLFCACALICERMRLNGEVDLYHTVKHMKRRRPQFISTFVRR